MTSNLNLKVLFFLPLYFAMNRPLEVAKATGPHKPITQKPYHFKGLLTQVRDGDIVYLQHNQQSLKIRLYHIDAPELKQPYGDKSAQLLSQWILNQEVQADCLYRDSSFLYHCYLILGNENINLKLVRKGLAWVQQSSLKEPLNDPYFLHSSFLEAEKLAQKEQEGLWKDKNPTPPWVWKSNKKNQNLQKNSKTLKTLKTLKDSQNSRKTSQNSSQKKSSSKKKKIIRLSF
jgi:micrococcal nuclease